MNLWQRLKYLSPAFRRAEERDMQEELESLAAMAGQGELGNLTLAAEQRREVWGWTWLERLQQDLQYALRTMRKSPGFTATAVACLALGIGANTAIFGLIDALMLRWLPVRDPQQLIQVKFKTKGAAAFAESFSYPVTRSLDRQRELFAGVTGFSGANFTADLGGTTAKMG